ncbi:MAG: hypothetical protein B6U87_01430 [Candidatus Aenigmarchaeota archaeon ex4484_52]|nr:MAG: hypothetical protein B6U87_01430 [Candidatus Aenigmarchaeota archaeon ex4484_52]
MDRIKTGIKGLDELLNGGIPKNHLVLLSGQTGAGKTIFGLQYLIKGIMDYKEKGIFITFEQTKDDVFLQTKQFGWNIKDLEKKGLLKILCFKPTKMHLTIMTEQLEKDVKEFAPVRLVFDSISTYGVYAETISYFETMMDLGLKKENVNLGLTPQSVTRKMIMEIMGKIKSFGVTTLVISELPETSNFLSRDTISEFMADGVILLYYTKIGGEAFGNIEIRKMRYTNHKHGLYFTKIVKKGIEIGEECSEMIR